MTVVDQFKEGIPQPIPHEVDQVDEELFFIWKSSLSFSFQSTGLTTISVGSIKDALYSAGKSLAKKLIKKAWYYLEEKMERVFHLVRGAGLVTGHIVGQAITLGVFRSHIHDIHAELQQLTEQFGRSVPIVVAETISPALAETLVKSSNPGPWDISRIQPKLRVFRRGKQHPIEITWRDCPDEAVSKLEEFGAFDTTRLVFVTHGFIHHIDVDWMNDMKNALLEHEDLTVIVVGWGGGANIGVDRYEQAAKNIESVGCWLANHLREIRRKKSQTYLWGVGHSLGAHLMGFAGKCSQSLDRITGLDPAGPNFETDEIIASRLSATDAKFVDVIHTDGYSKPWTLQSITAPTNHYGTLIPMGTVDFYPNWGHSQPGCETFSFIGSHNRAFSLFTQTIFRPGKFKTSSKLKESPTYMNIKKDLVHEEEEVEMGFHCEGGSGNYYIEVNEEDITIPLVFGIP